MMTERENFRSHELNSSIGGGVLSLINLSTIGVAMNIRHQAVH
jgi:hypothetical protein